MSRDTTRGLHVWDLGTDQFDHTELAANWDRIEQLVSAGAQSIDTVTSLPTQNLFNGRVVVISVATGGFPAWTMLIYNGTQWKPIGPIEILPVLPTAGNFAGRVVVLSGADSGFNAWDIVRYTGSSWGIVGGWQTINTGNGATNIIGVQTTGDVLVNSGNRGLILTDRQTGSKYRVYMQGGYLKTEGVT